MLDLSGGIGGQSAISLLYVDFKGRTFSGPVKVHTSFSKALLSIVDSAVKDARRLRNTFRRSNADRLAEDIWNVASKSQMLRQTLKALTGSENLFAPQGIASDDTKPRDLCLPDTIDPREKKE